MSNDTQTKCYICAAMAQQKIFQSDTYGITCKRCGHYIISHDSIQSIEYDREFPKHAHLFSGFFRFNYDRKIKDDHFFYPERKDEILNNPIVPRQNEIAKKARRFLEYLQLQSEYLGQQVSIRYPDDYPTSFAKNSDEFQAVLRHLIDASLIEKHPGSVVHAPFSLTVRGIDFLDLHNANSKQIFVAMAFTPEMIELIKSIQKDVESETGFRLILISDVEFNNSIDDRIIAEINQSAAVIADFTHNNRGAYFEAGLALGAGKPVIFICKAGNDSDGKPHIDKTHFDTNHRNHILWVDANDLKNKLIYRIKATIRR